MTAENVKAELQKYVDPERAVHSMGFFKTGEGEYGAGDQFLGLTVPTQRKIAKQFYDLPLGEIQKLLQSPFHEHRLVALFILVAQYRKAGADTKKHIASFYHKNRRYVNNWDLVDSSAFYILGDYLMNHSRAVLQRLAKSSSIWDRRIAMVSTLTFIRAGQLEDTFAISEILLKDSHDLIHKAVGWMLRCAGDVDRAELLNFLDKHAHKMPRTALRYCLEHLTPEQKLHYMNLKSVKPGSELSRFNNISAKSG